MDAYLKGMGYEISIWLKWYAQDNRHWLGETPADIRNIFNCSFDFILNEQFLAVQCLKLLNLMKALQNWQTKAHFKQL